MSDSCGIYAITNIITGDFYIGSSVELRRRLQSHRRHLDMNFHRNAHLQNSWNKHGKDNFAFEILLLCDRSSTLLYEQLLIDGLRPALNIAKSVTAPMLGHVHTEEHRRRLSESHKGIHPTEETNRKLSEANRGERHRMFGKHHTDETKRKISEANTGKQRSEEVNRINSVVHTGELNHNFGTHLSEETKKRISEAQAGRIFSEEHRRKISEAATGRIFSEGAKKKLSEMRTGELNHNFGKHLSEETKRKISESVRTYLESKRNIEAAPNLI